jgi:hypothetical protein
VVLVGHSGCGCTDIVTKMKLERRARYSLFKLERHDGCAKRSHGRAHLMLVTLYESIAVKIDYRICCQTTNTGELRFRALLSESGVDRLELARGLS